MLVLKIILSICWLCELATTLKWNFQSMFDVKKPFKRSVSYWSSSSKAYWSSWSSWSSCSGSCSLIGKSRTRRCIKTDSMPDCPGRSRETANCYVAERCPGIWSMWTDWSDVCSRTCGRGQRSRRRSCRKADTRMLDCPGTDVIFRDCHLVNCPGNWNTWSSWSACNHLCGFGERTRSRDCIKSGSQTDCFGSNTDTDNCFVECRGVWNSWGSWSNCSKSCGLGKKSRSRECIKSSEYMIDCLGSDIEVTNCYEKCTNLTALLCHQCRPSSDNECNNVSNSFLLNYSLSPHTGDRSLLEQPCSACMIKRNTKGIVIERGCFHDSSSCSNSFEGMNRNNENVHVDCCFQNRCN